MTDPQELENFISQNIVQYEQEKVLYENLAEILKNMLNKMAKTLTPEFFVQVRAKELVSYAEKIVRKKWSNPNYEIQDMCGSRVILPTMEEVKKFQKLVENNFNCLENEDKITTMSLDQFGYLSIHYTIQLIENSPFIKEIIPLLFKEINLKPIKGNKDFDFKLYCKLKAELQVRTILQHGWSVNGHDTLYKSKARIPNSIIRKYQRIAAILEEADNGFRDFSNQIILYEANYGAYMSDKEIDQEINKNLAIFRILKASKEKLFPIVKEIVKYARYRGKWDLIIEILNNYKDMKDEFVHREYGLALCKKFSPEHSNFELGRLMLEKACKLDPYDTDAITILGSTYLKENKLSVALKYYSNAYKINPRDTYSLGSYFRTQIALSKSLEILNISSPILNEAIQTTNWQISSDINMPWAYYDNGFFNLLLGNLDQAFRSYLNGIRFSIEPWMIDTNIGSLKVLDPLNILAVKLIKNLLRLGLAFRFDNKDVKKDLEQESFNSFSKSFNQIIILAGSISPHKQPLINEFHDNLTKAFSNFNGIIISGGLNAGINAIAGEIQEIYGNSQTIQTYGYPPVILPIGFELDTRYTRNIGNSNTNFDHENLIQYWIDIYCSGIPSTLVKVLGISGGAMASLEYQLGLVFNAHVGLLKDSAGEASKMLQDSIWCEPVQLKNKKHNIVQNVNNNVQDIQKFINSGLNPCLI